MYKFIRSRVLRAINDIDTMGEMGLYLEEKEDKVILLENQPNRLIPAIISIKNRSNSFLFMI